MAVSGCLRRSVRSEGPVSRTLSETDARHGACARRRIPIHPPGGFPGTGAQYGVRLLWVTLLLGKSRSTRDNINSASLSGCGAVQFGCSCYSTKAVVVSLVKRVSAVQRASVESCGARPIHS